MPGLVPGIHVFLSLSQDVDGRAKASGSDAVLRTAMPGHDGAESFLARSAARPRVSNHEAAGIRA
jgi:hypothetical protein